ncbi:MAG: hypothetical protein ACYC5O_10890 [Anaerolineae bacterium]
MGLPFWRDLSLILLVLEAFVMALPFLVIGYYMVKGLRFAHAWLAAQFPQWQALAVQGRDLVAQYAAIVASPVIAVAAIIASIAAVLRAVTGMAPTASAPGSYNSARGTYYGQH